MARIRTLKPEFFRSESLAQVPPLARLTFAGMWCEADAAGRGIANPKILKGAIWPLDDEVSADDVARHIERLAQTGHLQLYTVAEKRYYAVVNWENHQAASYRTGDATHPAPPERTSATLPTESQPQDASPNTHGENDGDSCNLHDLARQDVLYMRGGEGKGSHALRERATQLDPPSDHHQQAAAPQHTGTSVVRPKTNRKALYDALEHHLGPAITDTERGERGRHVSELERANASAEDIHARCAEYRRRMTVPLTGRALLKHWSSLAEADIHDATPRLTPSTQAFARVGQRIANTSAAAPELKAIGT